MLVLQVGTKMGVPAGADKVGCTMPPSTGQMSGKARAGRWKRLQGPGRHSVCCCCQEERTPAGVAMLSNAACCWAAGTRVLAVARYSRMPEPAVTRRLGRASTLWSAEEPLPTGLPGEHWRGQGRGLQTCLQGSAYSAVTRVLVALLSWTPAGLRGRQWDPAVEHRGVPCGFL